MGWRPDSEVEAVQGFVRFVAVFVVPKHVKVVEVIASSSEPEHLEICLEQGKIGFELTSVIYFQVHQSYTTRSLNLLRQGPDLFAMVIRMLRSSKWWMCV
jgi:hypothetical protein